MENIIKLNRKRDTYVDVAKGIGIMLIISIIPFVNMVEFIIFWIIWLKYYSAPDGNPRYNTWYTYWRFKDKFFSIKI